MNLYTAHWKQEKVTNAPRSRQKEMTLKSLELSEFDVRLSQRNRQTVPNSWTRYRETPVAESTASPRWARWHQPSGAGGVWSRRSAGSRRSGTLEFDRAATCTRGSPACSQLAASRAASSKMVMSFGYNQVRKWQVLYSIFGSCFQECWHTGLKLTLLLVNWDSHPTNDGDNAG